MRFLRNKKNPAVILFVLAMAAGAANAFAMAERFIPVSWRYKMTVVVETPAGVKTGSAVREISNAVPLVDLPDVGNPAQVKGEAVVVDLGPRGKLFALISDKSDDEFYQAFPVPGGGPSTPAGIKYYAGLQPGLKATLDPHRPPGYPKLVTFTDMNDPKSVTLAQVWQREESGLYTLEQDRMEELFGAGVKLREIVIETMDEPVTWGVVKWLPWLPDYYNLRLDGDRYGNIKAGNRIANSLSAGAFSTGDKK